MLVGLEGKLPLDLLRAQRKTVETSILWVWTKKWGLNVNLNCYRISGVQAGVWTRFIQNRNTEHSRYQSANWWHTWPQF